MSKLVIFDLDDTLLCADSEFHFTKYIVKQGMLDKDFYLEKIKAFDKDYRSGNLNFKDYIPLFTLFSLGLVRMLPSFNQISQILSRIKIKLIGTNCTKKLDIFKF